MPDLDALAGSAARALAYLPWWAESLILIVACCNIISLLVLLVNDKKKEIGILQSMGASSMSIAAIAAATSTGMTARRRPCVIV